MGHKYIQKTTKLYADQRVIFDVFQRVLKGESLRLVADSSRPTSALQRYVTGVNRSKMDELQLDPTIYIQSSSCYNRSQNCLTRKLFLMLTLEIKYPLTLSYLISKSYCYFELILTKLTLTLSLYKPRSNLAYNLSSA